MCANRGKPLLPTQSVHFAIGNHIPETFCLFVWCGIGVDGPVRAALLFLCCVDVGFALRRNERLTGPSNVSFVDEICAVALISVGVGETCLLVLRNENSEATMKTNCCHNPF